MYGATAISTSPTDSSSSSGSPISPVDPQHFRGSSGTYLPRPPIETQLHEPWPVPASAAPNHCPVGSSILIHNPNDPLVNGHGRGVTGALNAARRRLSNSAQQAKDLFGRSPEPADGGLAAFRAGGPDKEGKDKDRDKDKHDKHDGDKPKSGIMAGALFNDFNPFAKHHDKDKGSGLVSGPAAGSDKASHKDDKHVVTIANIDPHSSVFDDDGTSSTKSHPHSHPSPSPNPPHSAIIPDHTVPALGGRRDSAIRFGMCPERPPELRRQSSIALGVASRKGLLSDPAGYDPYGSSSRRGSAINGSADPTTNAVVPGAKTKTPGSTDGDFDAYIRGTSKHSGSDTESDKSELLQPLKHMWHKMLHPHDKDPSHPTAPDNNRRQSAPAFHRASSPNKSDSSSPTSDIPPSPIRSQSNPGVGTSATRGSPSPMAQASRLASVSEEKDRDGTDVHSRWTDMSGGGIASSPTDRRVSEPVLSGVGTAGTNGAGGYQEWKCSSSHGSGDHTALLEASSGPERTPASASVRSGSTDESISITTALEQVRSPADNASLKHPDPNVRDPSPPPPPPIASRTNTDVSVASGADGVVDESGSTLVNEVEGASASAGASVNGAGVGAGDGEVNGNENGTSHTVSSSTPPTHLKLDIPSPPIPISTISTTTSIPNSNSTTTPSSYTTAASTTPSTSTSTATTTTSTQSQRVQPYPARIPLRRGSSDSSSHRGYSYSSNSATGASERNVREKEKERAVLGFHARITNIGQGYQSGF